MMTKLHARPRAAHLLISHHRVTILVATSILIGSQIDPALACTHTHMYRLSYSSDNRNNSDDNNATLSCDD